MERVYSYNPRARMVPEMSPNEQALGIAIFYYILPGKWSHAENMVR